MVANYYEINVGIVEKSMDLRNGKPNLIVIVRFIKLSTTQRKCVGA
jgi:hypothetical protein